MTTEQQTSRTPRTDLKLDDQARKDLLKAIIDSSRELDESVAAFNAGDAVGALEHLIRHNKHRDYIVGNIISQHLKLADDYEAYQFIFHELLVYHKGDG